MREAFAAITGRWARAAPRRAMLDTMF